jgi:signal transduction histidine kinase
MQLDTTDRVEGKGTTELHKGEAALNSNGRIDEAEARTGNAENPATVIESGQGQIRPRARLIRTLGAELISSEVVAVIELVRNSYDADATRVEVRFTDPHRAEEASLEIRDDGHGMTREILLGPWLEPATDFKTSGTGEFGGERSPDGRRRLGSKGVGRFAAQRLGSHLQLQTSTGGESVLEARFDWEALDRADRYLDELVIPWHVEESPGVQAGTSLLISGLRDKWTEDRFDRLRLALSRLLGPGIEDDEFSIVLVVNRVEEQIEAALDATAAMYSIEGRVDPGGRCAIRYRDITGSDEEWVRSVLWPSGDAACGPFEFRIAAWDLDRDALEYFFEKTGISPGLRAFRRLIRDHSGISLYRDGFRILPYGEPDNDWLRLDRRRVNNPTMRLSNNQMLGWLHLSADDNPGLCDQTNREGLVANDAYAHLRDVVLEILHYLENKRFRVRRTLGLGSGRRVSALPSVEPEREDEVQELLGRLQSADGAGAGDDLVEELRRAYVDKQEAMVEAIREYASLATVGQLAGLVFRQLAHPMRQLETELDGLSELIDELEPPAELKEEIRESLQRLTRLADEERLRLDKLDPLAVARRNKRSRHFDLRNCLMRVLEAMDDIFDEYGLEVYLEPEEELVVETDPHVVQSVLAILLQNSLDWLVETPLPVVEIKLEESGFSLSNNGPAIPQEHIDSIFDPYFTMREDAAGLGLTLARDLIAAAGGTIQAIERSNGVCFRVNFAR